MPNVGEMAPDFALQNQNGDTVRLSDLRGKKVVLFAFPKADTPGCTTQACGFRDNYARLQGDNTVVLGISPDPVADLRKWQDKAVLPYDLLSDEAHTVLDAWGAWGEKSMYGKKYEGVIRSHWVIDEEGRLLDVQIKVSPTDSVERALKAVRGGA